MFDEYREELGRQVSVAIAEILIVTFIDHDAFRSGAAPVNLVCFADPLSLSEQELFLADEIRVSFKDDFRKQVIIGGDYPGDAAFGDACQAG